MYKKIHIILYSKSHPSACPQRTHRRPIYQARASDHIHTVPRSGVDIRSTNREALKGPELKEERHTSQGGGALRPNAGLTKCSVRGSKHCRAPRKCWPFFAVRNRPGVWNPSCVHSVAMGRAKHHPTEQPQQVRLQVPRNLLRRRFCSHPLHLHRTKHLTIVTRGL